MRAVALLLCLTVSTACFPNNPKARFYSKLAEGAVAIAGVALLTNAKTSADCRPLPGRPDTDCASSANTRSDIGFGMILAGIVGFIVTITTEVDDKPAPIAVAPLAPTAAPPVTPPATTAPPAPSAPSAPAAPPGGTDDPTEPVPN